MVAVPLGEDFRVTGKPIRMTTTNVSHDGIGLIHTQYLRAPFYALDFEAEMPTDGLFEARRDVRVRADGPRNLPDGAFLLTTLPPVTEIRYFSPS